MFSLQLIIVLIGHALSGVAMLIGGVVAFINGPSKKLHRLYFLMMVAAFVYETGFIIIQFLPTRELAMVGGMSQATVFILFALIGHFMLAVAEKDSSFRWYVIALYTFGLVGFLFSILFPETFLFSMQEKLYFRWYIDAGPLHFVMFLFSILATMVPFFYLTKKLKSVTGLEKRRIEYFVVFFNLALPLGLVNYGLAYDIPIDPFIGAFIAVAMVPIGYGIVADQLFDIRKVVAGAALYSGGVASLAALLALLISLNNVILNAFPWVQFWTIPIFTAVVAFSIGRLFWQKLLENDRIKYEFITVATHKLRTPLTQISWSVRTLLESNLTPEVRATAEHIQKSSNRLIELTNILFETTEESTQSYAYEKIPVPLLETTRTVLSRLDPFVQAKQLTVNIHADDEVVVQGDSRRLGSVIEVLLENAINYSSRGGLIQIIAYVKGSRAFYSVRDHGIGVSPEDQKRIFTRFYRTDAARRADTEGVGLGLAMAKSIIEKHQGTIGVESSGDGTGSVFWFSLPLGQQKE